MGYTISAKNGDAYAIMDSSTGMFEALYSRDIEILLHAGVKLVGASLDSNGKVVFSNNIQEMSDDAIDEDNYEEEIVEEVRLDEEGEDEDIEEEIVEEVEIYEEDAYDDDYEYEEVGILSEDVADEFEAEESSFNKLYSYLNQRQIEVLKRYYLWYSQRVFRGVKPDQTLGMKVQKNIERKKKELSRLRAKGSLWHYAGFIDMGRFGAGRCTLNHPLEYMHLAWNVGHSDIKDAFFGNNYNADIEKIISSEDCIVFGIKCLADFFEADKDLVTLLNGVQRESLREMDEMARCYEDGRQDDIKSTFRYMDDLVEGMIKVKDLKGYMMDGDDYKGVIQKPHLMFYDMFRSNDMIPPRSLVALIRDDLIGWSSHKFTGGMRGFNYSYLMDKLYSVIKDTELIEAMKSVYNMCCKYDTKVFDISYSSSISNVYKASLYDMFVIRICGVYAYDSDTNKSEGGNSKTTRSQLYYINKASIFNEKYEYAGTFNGIIDFIEKLLNEIVRNGGVMDIFSHDSILGDVNDYSFKRLMRFGTLVGGKFLEASNEGFEEIVNFASSHLRELNEIYKNRKIKYESYKDLVGSENNTIKSATKLKDDIKKYIGMMNTLVNHLSSGNYTAEAYKDTDLYKGIYAELIEAKSVDELDDKYRETLGEIRDDMAEIRHCTGNVNWAEYSMYTEVYPIAAEWGMAYMRNDILDYFIREIYYKIKEIKEDEEQKRKEAERKAKDKDKKEEMTTEDYIDFLDDNYIPANDTSFEANVARTCKRQGWISSKQLVYVKRYYNKATGKVVESGNEKSKLSDHPEYNDALEWYINNGSDDKTKAICKSVKRYGQFSVRQKKYIDNALKDYKNK